MDNLGNGAHQHGGAHQRGKADTPVAVLSRAFPVDTTLSDLWRFLRDSLGQAALSAEEMMHIDATVANALTDIGDDTKTVTVSLRVFSHSLEIDVLLSDSPPDIGGRTRVTHGRRHTSHRQRRQP